MSTSLSPDEGRLRSYFEAFTSPEVGGTTSGGVSRPAASDMDAEARRRLVEIMDGLGLRTRIDDIGNMYGRYANADNEGAAPVVIGSHLDTVVPGGRYDGILGVVLALETIALLQERDVHGSRPVELVNFTGEEGARFAPAMLGSGVATAFMMSTTPLHAQMPKERYSARSSNESDTPGIDITALVSSAFHSRRISNRTRISMTTISVSESSMGSGRSPGAQSH